jgi:hypothetical protein
MLKSARTLDLGLQAREFRSAPNPREIIKNRVKRGRELRMLYQEPLREIELDDTELLKRLREGDSEARRIVADCFRRRLRDAAAITLPTEVSSRLDAYQRKPFHKPDTRRNSKIAVQ